MSKGSKRRPLKVDKKTFEDNWNRIFKNDTTRTDKHSDASSNRDRDMGRDKK